ncbi:MAG: sporulation protein YqfD [Hungatella sp.]|nr:sporulation protein YqfD [Hungatella sp.]
MVWKISRWAEGYLGIRIRGYGAERFFNLLKTAGFGWWGARQKGDGYYFYIKLKDFYKIRPFLRKTHMSMKICSREGLPFFLHRNRKRKALALAILSFFVLLYVMSLFIWNISFEGNRHYSRETLLDYLETKDIRYGMIKGGISCDDLEEGIRSAFPDITWVSARVSGTRLLVKIKENEVLSAVPDKENEPCEVIAANGGIVTRIIVRQGKAAVAVGDTVEEGQQLIAGQLSIFNDAGEVVRTAYVHGDGDVYARTRYVYEELFYQYHTVEAKTGDVRRGWGIAAGPYRFRFLMPSPEDKSWNYVSTIRQLCLFEDFYLPFYAESIEGEGVVTYERPYRQEEKEEAARRLQENYQKKLMEKGVQIIENNVKIQEDGVLWKIEGTIVGEEQIGIKRYITEFEKIEETKGTDEHN